MSGESEMNNLDCLVIGYNDAPLANSARRQKRFQQHSGTYGEIKTNSVLLGGERVSYMDLLNHMITEKHSFNPNLNAFEVPNLGAVYLTSFLRKRGFSAELINSYNIEKDRLNDLLQDSPRSVVITTTYYVEEEPVKEIIEFIRSRQPQTKIILGGPYVYNLFAAMSVQLQNFVFQSLGADIYITDSQGEATLAQVLNCLRHNKTLAFVPNLVYRNGNSFARTLRVEEKNSLDENSIDWRFFEPSFFTPTTYMRTSRSCPFKCAFCNYPEMSGEHNVAEIETVRAELRYLVDYGLKYIIFVDDTFNVPLPRFKKLCKMMIEERFDLKWISFFRCSNADDECFDLMQRSGCLGVYLGIESGDQGILKNMNKFADVQKYREAIKKLHERGILTFGSFIVGFPGETEESVMNTKNFIEDTAPTFYNVHNPLAPINQRRAEFAIQGSYYNWSHKTMNWQEGAEWVDYLLRNINNSLPLTLYGFSLWSIPYLLQNGFSIDQIKAFARVAKSMLVKSLDDTEVDYSKEQEEMGTVLAGWHPSLRRRAVAQIHNRGRGITQDSILAQG
jgi:p-methyltransferase